MRISTRLRLISLKNNLKADVAKIVLNNVEDKSDKSIARWMRDVDLNGCAYMTIRGLTYHNEIQKFYKDNQRDIDLIVSAYEDNETTKTMVVGNKDSVYTWQAFEYIINEFMLSMHI